MTIFLQRVAISGNAPVQILLLLQLSTWLARGKPCCTRGLATLIYRNSIAI
jgi:hypothetical protein